MKDLIILLFKKFQQFIKFGITGVINTLIYTGLYYLLLFLGVSHLIANVVAYFTASINGYMMSRGWVFKEVKATVKESVWKYYVVYGSSLILSEVLIYLFVDVMLISDKIAPLLTLCFTIPYNFLFQKLWAFRKDKREAVETENKEAEESPEI